MKILPMRLQAGSVCLFLLGAGVAHAHSVKTKSIEIIHPWTYETAGVLEPSAPVFMKFKNHGRRSDRLLGAVTSRATTVELRGAPQLGSGVTQRVAAIEIKPAQDVELSASGYSLQLSGVTKAFSAYDTFKMTLTFERAGRIEIEVLIEER